MDWATIAAELLPTVVMAPELLKVMAALSLFPITEPPRLTALPPAEVV